MDIVLRRAPKTAGSPPFSDLRFTYRETDPVTSPFPLPSGRKFERGVVEVALPTRWEPLPRTGEPVAKRVHVVEGSHLVGPVLFGDCGIWGGFNAVLAVTADYARQMTVSVGGPVGRLDHDEEYRKQGARVVISSYDGAWVIGVERGDERYVFLSRCSEHGPR